MGVRFKGSGCGGWACRAGTRGMHKSPSVRACMGRAPPVTLLLLPGRVQERIGGGSGQGFPLVRWTSHAGQGSTGRGVRVAPSGPRPEPGGFQQQEGGDPTLFDDEAAGQVLREVLEEFGGGPGAVSQLQFLQLLQLHQARQPGGGQQRASCGGPGGGSVGGARGRRGISLRCPGPKSARGTPQVWRRRTTSARVRARGVITAQEGGRG